MTQTSDITLIGGGILGLLTAKEFIDAGYSVTLIDKSSTGTESSWAGGGILLPIYPWRQPQDITTLVLKSIQHYPTLAQQLLETTGIDPEWYDCGLLICKNPDYEQAVSWCKTNNIIFDTECSTLFSQLNTQPEHPLWLPTIAQARNPRLLKSLKAYLLMQQKMTFIEQCEVIDCTVATHHINTLITTQGNIAVNQLIITTGAWTHALLSQLLPEYTAPDIHPVKGQMLLFDAKPATLSCMVLDNSHYLIPRRDGKILAGSSVEHTQFDKKTTEEMKNTLHHFAIHLLPELQNYPLLHHWAGLRPGSPEGVPTISQHPIIDNLGINAGHFRNGLVMAPASAQLMADIILKRPPSIDPIPYQLNLA